MFLFENDMYINVSLHASIYTPGEGSRVPPLPFYTPLGPILICFILGILGDGSWIFAMALPQKSNQKCPASRSPPPPAAPQVHSGGVAYFSGLLLNTFYRGVPCDISLLMSHRTAYDVAVPEGTAATEPTCLVHMQPQQRKRCTSGNCSRLPR